MYPGQDQIRIKTEGTGYAYLSMGLIYGIYAQAEWCAWCYYHVNSVWLMLGELALGRRCLWLVLWGFYVSVFSNIRLYCIINYIY